MAACAPYRIRPYDPQDLARVQEITAHAFGPVSIDKNMETLLGPFGSGDWRDRKVAAIAEDCRLQADGIFVAEDVRAHRHPILRADDVRAQTHPRPAHAGRSASLVRPDLQ